MKAVYLLNFKIDKSLKNSTKVKLTFKNVKSQILKRSGTKIFD